LRGCASKNKLSSAQLSLFGLFPVNQKKIKLNLKVTLNSFAVSLKLFNVIGILPSSVPVGNCNCNNFKHFSTNICQVSQIGRRPQLFKQMEDNLNF
jgi:hypothetical protein